MKYVLRFVTRVLWWCIKKALLITLILGGIVVGVIMSLVIGGMGLALMGTAIGIGPVGWIGLGIVAVKAGYGFFVVIRNTKRS